MDSIIIILVQHVSRVGSVHGIDMSTAGDIETGPDRM